jgi:hypothetical protein
MAQIYQYEAIDPKAEFRLLLLKAGTDSDALRADIRTASFGDAVKYIAVSYAWGPDIKTKQLITPKGSLPITVTLASALNCFRSRSEDVLLWADAVCINQSDNGEKNHQVRRIRDIYAGADLVRVHLGVAGDNSELVPSLIETLAIVDIGVRYDIDQNFPTVPQLRTAVIADDEGLLPPLKDPPWEAIRAILRRPWFRRVWVVQEFTVARDVAFHCGSWSLPWGSVTRCPLADQGNRRTAARSPVRTGILARDDKTVELGVLVSQKPPWAPRSVQKQREVPTVRGSSSTSQAAWPVEGGIICSPC